MTYQVPPEPTDDERFIFIRSTLLDALDLMRLNDWHRAEQFIRRALDTCRVEPRAPETAGRPR